MPKLYDSTCRVLDSTKFINIIFGSVIFIFKVLWSKSYLEIPDPI